MRRRKLAAAASMLWVGIGLGAPVPCSSAPITSNTPYAFDVRVIYSKSAARTLSARRGGVIAAASYYADAAHDAERFADQVGRIDLGREEVTRSTAQTRFRFTGRVVRRERVALTAGAVAVNVNIYSARRSSDDNLLGCTIFEGPVREARSQSVILRCKLLSEN